jgi:hypothetical protein
VQHAIGPVLPVLVAGGRWAADDPQAPVLDEFLGELSVGYTLLPPYGQGLITWPELEGMGLSRRVLRRRAADCLDGRVTDARVHGQPPALMLAFDGMASTLLLADSFWRGLASSVPGELVVGVPARDVVIVTGSESRPGLEKVRRAVDRVHFAGDRGLLTKRLLVRRRGVWEHYQDRSSTMDTGRPAIRAEVGVGAGAEHEHQRAQHRGQVYGTAQRRQA